MFSFIADKFIPALGEILNEFPLIVATQNITRLLDCCDKLRKKEIERQDIATTVDKLCAIVSDVLHARFADVFHRILMHPGITANEFKKKIRDIELTAESIERKINEHQQKLLAENTQLNFYIEPPTIVTFIGTVFMK